MALQLSSLLLAVFRFSFLYLPGDFFSFQNSFFREYVLPLPAFLMWTELRASKNNISYEIKVNKHYFKIINDLEILHRTQETIQEREWEEMWSLDMLKDSWPFISIFYQLGRIPMYDKTILYPWNPELETLMGSL